MKPSMPGRFVAVLAVAALLGSGAPLRAEDSKLQVLATTTDLASIVRSVGGDAVEVTCLMVGPEDPHFLTAKPSFVRRAHDADVFVKVGMDLEVGYEGPIVRDARNARIQPGAPGYCDASTRIDRLEVPAGVVDRSMGDVHPQGNPHYLLDPVRAKTVAATIADSLAAADPPRAAAFRAGAERFAVSVDEAMFGAALLKEVPAKRLERHLRDGTLATFLKEKELEGKLGGWAKTMLPHAGRSVADYHSTFAYLAERFHLDAATRLESKPGIPPTPRQLKGVIETIRAKRIAAILHCTYQPADTVETVAGETGARAVLLAHQPGAVDGTDDYLAMMGEDIRRLAAALGAADGK